MATFRVGQRVKKVLHRYQSDPPNFGEWDPKTVPPVPMGSEGDVTEVRDGYLTVLFDNVRSPSSRGSYSMRTYQMEPLQPERNQTIAWSECAWKPPHMREIA